MLRVTIAATCTAMLGYLIFIPFLGLIGVGIAVVLSTLLGNAAAFLCSDLAAGISGEVLYVDGGFHTVGMSFPSDGDGA